MIDRYRYAAKAVHGAVVAGLGAAATALADGGITGLEWVVVALATVVAFGVVFQTTNVPLGPRFPGGTTYTPEGQV